MCIVHKVHSKHTHIHTHTHIYIGQAGQQPGVVKPFDTLNITQIKQEVRRQELYRSETTKAAQERDLKSSLRGIQRVPSLLHNPNKP